MNAYLISPIVIIAALGLGSCKVKNATLDRYKKNAYMLQHIRADKNKVVEVLGPPSSTLSDKDTLTAIQQFKPNVTKRELQEISARYSLFYTIDPDNTLIICFNDADQITGMFFGAQ